MKLFACLLILLLPAQICIAQKRASLTIKSDQNSLSLINSIYIHKNDKSLHTWLFDTKNIFIRDLDSGYYRIEYITYFLDTIVKDLHIDEYQKIKILYPDKNFYNSTESLDTLIEDFLINNIGAFKVYIKSNIYDHTFYHQVLQIMKDQDNYSGYYSCHNYGPDRSEGLSDTIALLDLSKNYIKRLIEFLYHNHVATNPSAFVNCNHFNEVYVMNNKKYFYFNFCEDDLEKTFILVSEF